MVLATASSCLSRHPGPLKHACIGAHAAALQLEDGSCGETWCEFLDSGSDFQNVGVSDIAAAMPVLQRAGVPFYVHAELPTELPLHAVSNWPCTDQSASARNVLAGCELFDADLP